MKSSVNFKLFHYNLYVIKIILAKNKNSIFFLFQIHRNDSHNITTSDPIIANWNGDKWRKVSKHKKKLNLKFLLSKFVNTMFVFLCRFLLNIFSFSFIMFFFNTSLSIIIVVNVKGSRSIFCTNIDYTHIYYFSSSSEI